MATAGSGGVTADVRGVHAEAPSVDDLAREADAVFLSLADDRTTLALATPDGRPRAAWSELIVVNTATVSPETSARLRDRYGDTTLRNVVAAEIVGDVISDVIDAATD